MLRVIGAGARPMLLKGAKFWTGPGAAFRGLDGAVRSAEFWIGPGAAFRGLDGAVRSAEF